MATQTEVARHLSLTDRQLRRLQKLPVPRYQISEGNWIWMPGAIFTYRI
ncbi:hypothetical protein EC32608_1106 [Escherichia coli 3.2608]|nr:hypothetical protein EC32608_1106 [Escherichia coli 3.2608]